MSSTARLWVLLGIYEALGSDASCTFHPSVKPFYNRRSVLVVGVSPLKRYNLTNTDVERTLSAPGGEPGSSISSFEWQHTA